MALNTTEELIEQIRQGRMVILMDDEDRENEGDLVLAAACVKAEDINFMARFGRGLICLTLAEEHCRRLNLSLMTNYTYSTHSTSFMVSIEAAEGVTTGISAADRARTIQAAVHEGAKPSDLVQPGHVFPLMAQPGGVLSRAGHTEAGCDLARLAGFQSSAVIVEILKDDGTMARRPDLEQFAGQHDLKIGTIADLIRFRIENEKTVRCINRCAFPTEHGNFTLLTYEDTLKKNLHFAMVKGKIDGVRPVFVRVQLENPILELAGSNNRSLGWSVHDVLRRISCEEAGVIVLLCNQIEPGELINQIENLEPNQKQAAIHPRQEARDLRTIGLGAQILLDIGVKKMRVLSAPKRIHALSGFGLEVVEYIS